MARRDKETGSHKISIEYWSFEKTVTKLLKLVFFVSFPSSSCNIRAAVSKFNGL